MVAVIGDLHGCFHTLSKLYALILKNYPDVPVYCVGDLVDRGKYSFETVEFVRKNRISFTAGNHDYMFYYFIKHPSSPLGRSWIYNGSESTLNSYSNRYAEMNKHLRFLINAPLILNLNDCFISHAGVSAHYSRKLGKFPLSDINKLKDVVESDLNGEHGILWTRDKLLDLGKLQIVGHTRFDEILYDEKGNALYIDTAACSGNKLTVVIINENELVDTISVNTIPQDIE
ncbi:MAG TPA: metallophosphoesterase [Ignavibacteriaceae bacterium]|nr:metallophosphoesterase [Ignavibacteriaceae bacterium]